MKSADTQRVHPNQTQYAYFSALLRLRLAEIESALDRHEMDRQNWDHPEVLAGLDRTLADALVLILKRPDAKAPRLVTFPPPLPGP